MSAEPIILYDLARPGPEDMSESEQCWSGNTWKTRFALNIKGIPYRTEWVKIADVEDKMKSLGLGPQPGPLPYTVPTIVNPSTKEVITDSFAIAQYLDKTYTDTPALVPPGTAALQRAFVDKVMLPLLFASLASLIQPVYGYGCADEADRAHYRRTREAWFKGMKLEDIWKMGDEKLEGACKAVGEVLNEMGRYAEATGEGNIFVSGGAPWFVDTAIVAAFKFMIKACGEEHPMSKVILEHAWASKILAAFEKWE